MRESYAHEVELFWVETEDERAPGGAITTGALRGARARATVPGRGALDGGRTSEHGARGTRAVRVRTGDEESVRERIDTALAREWQVLATRTGTVRDDEIDHAARLVVS